jgi:hypothetical protein
MSGKKLIECLLALLVACSFSNPTIASPLRKDSTFHQTLSLFAWPATSNSDEKQSLGREQDHRLKKLQTGAYGKWEDFTAKARLVFKTDNRLLVDQSKNFALDSPISKFPKEWKKNKQLFSWRKNGRNRLPLNMPLTLAKENLTLQLSNYDELWLDFSALPGVPLCTPELELGFKPYDQKDGKLQTLVARTDAGSKLTGLSDSSLKDHFSIDATKANWKKKDFNYRAKRVLGLSPEKNWFYTQDPDYAVLQHRLHASLDNVEALDILLAPGVRAEAINLFVSDNDNFRRGKMIGFAELANKAHPSGDPSAVRLNLRDALGNTSQSDKHKIFLQEIIIFIGGDASALVNSKPVRKISFLINDNKQSEKLKSKIVDINKLNQRLVVDVRKVSQQGEVDLNKTMLQLQPSLEVLSCAIRIEQLQAVRAHNREVPAFALRLEDWSRRWGGPFKVTDPRPNHVENPGIIAYLPFNQIQSVSPKNQTFPNRLITSINNGNKVDFNLLNFPNGTTISADGGLIRASLEDDLLALEGRAQGREINLPMETLINEKSLEINWPLEALINENSWFYFSLTDGSNFVEDIEVSLFLADGSSIKRRIIPNQPIHLVATKVEVKNVKVRIRPAVVPYVLKLREMAFFEPQVATYNQAFVTPLPVPYTLAPKPELQSAKGLLLQAKPGQVAGLVSDWPPENPLRFSTVLDPALYLIGGIRLKYNLPPSYNLDKRCPLMLQFNWASRKTKRQVCFDQANGVTFIPITSFPESNERQQSFGNLQSIDWTFRPVNGTEKELMASFDFSFSIEGWTMLSFADQLRLSPLFVSGQTPIFADVNSIMEFPKDPNVQKKWLSLEENSLSAINEAAGHIQAVKNELFTIDQVAIEPKQQMIWKHWWELIERPTQSPPTNGSKFLFPVILILLAWLTRKKTPFIITTFWTLGTGSVKTVSRFLLWILDTTQRVVWRWLPQINLMIGLIALGPGIWIAGLLGWSFAGIMVLILVGLVTWGAFCHWQEHSVPNSSGDFSSLRTNFSLLTLSFGCAIWSLGQYKLSYQTLLGLLPVLGIIYVFLPKLYRRATGFILQHTHYLRPLGWFISGMALYGLGFLAEFVLGSGKTIFFALGGLSMVAAIRSGLLILEPEFRRLFPVIFTYVYERPGSLFFSGALLMLIPTTITLSINLNQIGEQLAIIVYYFLVIGLIFEINALVKSNTDRHV